MSGQAPDDPWIPDDEEVGRDFYRSLRDSHDDALLHSLSFVLDVPSQPAAESLHRALAASLGDDVQSVEVTHHDDATRHWAVRAVLAPRLLTEAYITALHRQLRESSAAYEGHVAKFSLLRHPSYFRPETRDG